ncbi:hypothetical protein [Maritimibacter sp. UBA3975]|uniref:hypothetical protein n=1 Tax=Maritimibacter sp. UBA3975 TaxID=1946833 RepID=UPI000C0A07FF|nr:hypothetical protein [Maritimibacter sp. UBA3975]MAM61838.1 hypothetical protein [Maritimibacter sp.]|tara:strand:- start:1760 stop:2113 length:354 start_codon:yes stop_codon:yes gene_type:complete
MGLFDGHGTGAALADLLEREKALILSGDIDGVARLSHEKERLMSRLARARFRRGELDRLREKANRNNALLEASARGFKAVQDQISALAKGSETLKIYGSDGNRAAMGRKPTDFNKRA